MDEAARRQGGAGQGGYGRFLLGCVLAAGLLTGLAELYLRLFPPRDLYPYLGEASPLTGLYVPDTDFGVAYRSWEALRADNAERLDAFGPLGDSLGRPPVWAFFGNSFVQAPGMLADTARAAVHDHRIFNLGRNELPEVRLAQIKMLLDHGLEPERVFVVLMSPDLIRLGEQPLASEQVTGRGALTYRPRLPPGPAGWVVRHSRLAFTGWCRTELQRGNPRFDRRTLSRGIDQPLWGDVCRLFGHLARVTHAHQVPVTVILIPSYYQAVEGEGFAFQDQLRPMFRALGFDLLDPREAFCRHPAPASLYLPDKHLTPEGNRLLLAELLAHVRPSGAVARLPREGSAP